MKPIVPPKYDVQFNIENGNEGLLQLLEPWCDRIVIDLDKDKIKEYIDLEQPNTDLI